MTIPLNYLGSNYPTFQQFQKMLRDYEQGLREYHICDSSLIPSPSDMIIAIEGINLIKRSIDNKRINAAMEKI